MDLQLHSFSTGGASGSLVVSDSVFAEPYREALIHQVVTAYFAAARSGTKKQKTRAEVRGGGRKPWKQKGSGQARAGTTRGPLWRTGGRAFAARPRNYEQKVNRKMYRLAIRSILSELLREGRMMIVDQIDVATINTKALALKLADYRSSNVLLIAEEMSEALFLSARTLFWVGLAEVDAIDPALLISFDKVVITQGAINRLQERLS